MGGKMRIYIGGLGATVMEADLRKTFSSPVLGTVESVEIIRSKGRSFAYLDFIPASEKGLAMLFSKYNGCMWKGGRLKLEKAKEHYLFRLRREWTEDKDTNLGKRSPGQNGCADVHMHTLQTTTKNLDMEKMHLRIYFPKLRKIKPLPLKGSGKHKYSFQRVEVPPLPVHFCDCEEHSVHLELAKKKFGFDLDTETCVNEEELSMMKSVLNKFLERENCAKSDSNEVEFTGKTCASIRSVDNDRGYLDDQMSDEDGLVINVISHPRGVSLVKYRGQEHELHGSKKSMHVFDEKRKASVSMDDANVMSPYKRKRRKQVPQDHLVVSRIEVATRPEETESGGSSQLTDGVALSRKSSWRDLVNQKGSSTFHLSDVLKNHDPVVASSNKREMCEEKLSADKELEKVPDIQPIKLSDDEGKKSSRGAAWLQKSSWLQLNLNNHMETTFRAQQTKPEKPLPENRDHPVGDLGKPREKSDTIITPEIPRITNSQALTKAQNHTTLEEQEDAAPPPTPATDKIAAQVPMPVPDIVISDTCPFMRSASSMKELAKMKATLSKKRGKLKEKQSSN
ncbi:hypothetical protein F511_06667 [Dorcoceras hygrometricum]|uniref:RRM domain-containing protein n=1 Tax=Dorcoceras hygrometricum TaxID=472368 RepID=A0A2Z7B0P2_9LAMI|nr:hypothetical protein F511_06667 [Dorcoceras hygrometricum]